MKYLQFALTLLFYAFCTCSIKAQALQWEHFIIGDNVIHSIAIRDSLCIVGTNTGVFLSKDNALTWIPTTLDSATFSVTISGTELFAGTRNSLFHSKDYGKTWVKTGLQEQTAIALIVSKGVVFAATGYGVSKSIDKGATWIKTDPYRSMTSLAASCNILLAGEGYIGSGGVGRSASYSGKVSFSTNNGTTWQQTTINSVYVKSVAFSGVTFLAGTHNGLLTSVDNGATWSQAGLKPVANALVASGSVAFAGTSSGVYRSNDNGRTWTIIGLDGQVIYTLALVGRTLLAGTARDGLWRTTLFDSIPSPILCYMEQPSALIEQPSALYIFPNPVSTLANIEFLPPQKQAISLSVFNSFGVEVDRIVDNNILDGGQRINWDTRGLANGVYFVRMSGGGSTTTKIIIVSH